jgi:hypothetical protein
MRSESQKCRQSVALQTRSIAHFAPGEHRASLFFCASLSRHDKHG